MIKSMNIAWWVFRWSELYPDKPAIIFDNTTISYMELHDRANRTACWLQSLGIEKGDRVIVMLGNCPEFIELYIACSHLGAIFVPVNFRVSMPELDYTIKNARPRLFVFDSKCANTFTPLSLNYQRPPMLFAFLGEQSVSDTILDYRNETASFSGQKPFLTRSLGPAYPEEPHVIMYTSGTTGQPKGAVLSHRKTFFNCLNADIFFNLQFDDIMLILLPLFHSGGLFIQASPILYKGATMVIHPKFDPLKTYEDIHRFKVTKFLGVPTVYRALLQVAPEQRKDLTSLKVCAIGGEKTTPALLLECRDAGFSLRQIMGQTETSILLWASEDESLRKPGTVGRPVFHAEVRLADRNGKTVGPGEVGEIVVRGSIMMKEYWQDPMKTEDTIRNSWLYTGDLARKDEDGYYYLVDRARDMYISGGENVYPAEVERVLKTHGGIEDLAIVGVPDPTWGEVGHAFVILKPEVSLATEELIAFCTDLLARYKWPKYVTFCDDFPRTSLGKVRKAVLINDHIPIENG
ncbi:MAG: long-chain fatty acid--CoA ligase [Syntrophus sp. (in: bacteria)]|nr:long-chain fatty acid--CoA ligase [Syntrophus sp. (in: bacteria)]